MDYRRYTPSESYPPQQVLILVWSQLLVLLVRSALCGCSLPERKRSICNISSSLYKKVQAAVFADRATSWELAPKGYDKQPAPKCKQVSRTTFAYEFPIRQQDMRNCIVSINMYVPYRTAFQKAPQNYKNFPKFPNFYL